MDRDARRWQWIHSYHEAGHVLRAVAWQIPVGEVSILPRGDGSGLLVGTETFRRKPSADLGLQELYIGLTISAAGEAAERRYRRGTRTRLSTREEASVRHGARADHQTMQKYYQHIPLGHHDEAVFWQGCYVDEWIELPETWQGIQLLAQAIYTRGVLNAWEIGAVLQTWEDVSTPAPEQTTELTDEPQDDSESVDLLPLGAPGDTGDVGDAWA
jgi:hypothetical protein